MTFKNLIGDRKFYKKAIAIAVPFMIQQTLTNLVSLLDNVMVGQISQSAVSAVAIANQLLFITTICFTGGLAGPGIFLSQSFGANDEEGIRKTFRIKAIFAFFIAIISILVFSFFGEALLGLFLQNPESITLAKQYLTIMMVGIIPLGISQLYATSFREIGMTKVPLVSGILAIITNVILNSLLIFGMMGFPALGVAGAAIATVIARFVEMFVLIAIAHGKKHVFAYKVYRNFIIGKKFFAVVLKKGLPLLANELLWSIGMTTLVFAYSTRGEASVAAINITTTTSNIVYTVFGALAASIGVMVGTELGAGKIENARKNAYQLITFAVFTSLCLGTLLVGASSFIPQMYKVSEETKIIARNLLILNGIFMSIYSFNAGCFYTLRAGGATIMTFVFDSMFTWLVPVPLALCLAYFTKIDVLLLYSFVQLADLIKSTIGFSIVRKGKWAKKLVDG